MNKLLNKICIGAAVLCSASVISSCTAGLTYEEADVYKRQGSSLLEILNAKSDLSRRAIVYEMQGFSFREYLNWNEKLVDTQRGTQHLRHEEEPCPGMVREDMQQSK